MAMLKRKVRTYKGLGIFLDDTARYSVAETTDEGPNVIADRFKSIGEAMIWIDGTQD